MSVAYLWTAIGGISSVTTGYWIENLDFSFVVTIESTHECEWYRVTC